jgi:hypothetical protein
MKMKSTILLRLLMITGFLVVLASCKKENSGPSDDGQSPVFLVKNAAVELVDTFKMGIVKQYDIPFSLEDEGEIRLRAEGLRESEGLIDLDGILIQSAEWVTAQPVEGILTFRPQATGRITFDLVARDAFDNATIIPVDFEVIGNWLPQPALSMEVAAELSPFHVQIDAGASFDRDADYGGQIMAYEYTIEGFYTTETIRAQIEYIFPEAGTYRVRLRVKDNDGEWSEPVTQSIVLTD